MYDAHSHQRTKRAEYVRNLSYQVQYIPDQKKYSRMIVWFLPTDEAEAKDHKGERCRNQTCPDRPTELIVCIFGDECT